MSGVSKSKQRFTSTDAVAVIALGLSVIAITLNILTEAIKDDSGERAQYGAEALAHQMASARIALVEEFPESAKSQGPSRGPSSVGEPAISQPMSQYEGQLGLDPWGKAYHYKLFRSGDSKVIRIVVWSSGPDQKTDTVFADDDLASSESRKKLSFRGDDIGYVYQR